MLPSQRPAHMDVSNTVDVTDPGAVLTVLRQILDRRYPGFDFSPVNTLIADFGRLYLGEYPGYEACDTTYHNLQHVLDVTLAMARLIDGHDGNCATQDRLGPQLALAGIACALFHDAGYIRRIGDNSARNGAVYTRIHVTRSARFMAEYFPLVGLQVILPVCERIVHFTGYEVNPDDIQVYSPEEWTLGALLGTADLIAQMADVDYLSKCHDRLYVEFEAGGIAGESGMEGYAGTIFRSPRHLLESTPDFIRTAIDVRLGGYFKGVYRYATAYFKGRNLYMEGIDDNFKKLELMLAKGQ